MKVTSSGPGITSGSLWTLENKTGILTCLKHNETNGAATGKQIFKTVPTIDVSRCTVWETTQETKDKPSKTKDKIKEPPSWGPLGHRLCCVCVKCSQFTIRTMFWSVGYPWSAVAGCVL